jgi:hypothetical protein
MGGFFGNRFDEWVEEGEGLMIMVIEVRHDNSKQEKIRDKEGIVDFGISDVGDNTIRFIGISHSLEFWEENSDELTRYISTADIVVSEFVPSELLTGSKELDMIFGALNQDVNDFYNNVVACTADNEKDLVCVDPDGLKFELYRGMLTYLQINSFFELAKTPVDFARKIAKTPVDFARKGPMSRREFLRTTGILALTACLDVMSPVSILTRFVFFPDSVHDYSFSDVDLVLPDAQNYRNVRSADNLVRLGQSVKEKNILYIAGKHHPARVKNYVDTDHTIERALKYPAHLVSSIFGENDIRYYIHNGQNWTRNENIK